MKIEGIKRVRTLIKGKSDLWLAQQTPAPWTKEGKKLIQELGLKMQVRQTCNPVTFKNHFITT